MQTFQPTIDFNTNIGASTSAATGITPYRIDCKVNGVEKNLALLIKSINGQGETPTSLAMLDRIPAPLRMLMEVRQAPARL